MLESTFVHLPGIGKKTEKKLWSSGVTTWQQYKDQIRPSLLTAGRQSASDKQALLDASTQALTHGDMAFFARHLPADVLYRIAMTFPEDTLFLDIETTGLSLQYDIVTLIGCSLGKRFYAHIQGSDETPLCHLLSRAKALVTFNGSHFDLNFLRQYFPDLPLPLVHIDLRFLAKQAGLAGGQKKIERIAGYTRQQDIQTLRGDAAPMLWHQYTQGNTEALRTLIRYNHEDIEGMKAVFSYCITELISQGSLPEFLSRHSFFASEKSQIAWEELEKQFRHPPFM